MLKDEFTIEELLKYGVNILDSIGVGNPLLDTQLLLCYILKVDKVYLYTHKEKRISKSNVDKFLSLIERRKDGYPLQYILGTQEFMGLDFEVGEGVLVPRPDTEILVEWLIEEANNGDLSKKEQINILDIGTGSGAISISLAHYIKNSFIYTIDISPRALEVAKKNARNLSLESRIKFMNGNLYEPLDASKEDAKFHIIVSNPPYIPSKEIDELQIEVASYEPRLALDGGEDGLEFYRKIVSESQRHLLRGGILAFEIGYNQGNQVKELLVAQGGFEDIQIRKDLSGLDRAIMCYWTGYIQ